MSARKQNVRFETNEVRRQNGARNVVRDKLLDKSAQSKARQLAKTGRLEHGTWWKIIQKLTGKRFGEIGEIIGSGQHDSVQIVREWKNSHTHFVVMTDKDFTHSGVGISKGRGGKLFWVQHFGKKK